MKAYMYCKTRAVPEAIHTPLVEHITIPTTEGVSMITQCS